MAYAKNLRDILRIKILPSWSYSPLTSLEKALWLTMVCTLMTVLSIVYTVGLGTPGLVREALLIGTWKIS